MPILAIINLLGVSLLMEVKEDTVAVAGPVGSKSYTLVPLSESPLVIVRSMRLEDIAVNKLFM